MICINMLKHRLEGINIVERALLSLKALNLYHGCFFKTLIILLKESILPILRVVKYVWGMDFFFCYLMNLIA